MFLNEIIVKKRQDVEQKKARLPLSHLMKHIEGMHIRRRDFLKELSAPGTINIIAEIKKASPSKGVLCPVFDPLRIAQLYEFGDACALSVLTEKHFFQGSLQYLRSVREVTAKPLLRKDFIIDRYQVFETIATGADACLLIAAILSVEEMRAFIEVFASYEITPLVEVHNENELKKALDAGARCIGINNRNLYSFDVSLEVSHQLMRMMPRGIITVSESGIRSHEDIQELRSVGVHAFLIGETLVTSSDIVGTLHTLRGTRS